MLKFKKDYYRCPMHRLVSAKTKELLDEIGEFSFERVLTECQLETLSEYIRWDYVRDEMEESGYDLLPVASLFFTKDRNKEFINEAGEKVRKINVVPGKFLPWGNGKVIAGYISESMAPQILRETYIKQSNAKAFGQVESVAAKETRMLHKGLLPDIQPLLTEGNLTAN